MEATDWIILTAIIGLVFLGVLVLFRGQIIRLLEKKYCHHEWEQYNVQRVFENDSDSRPYKVIHTLICTKCGEIKQFKAEG